MIPEVKERAGDILRGVVSRTPRVLLAAMGATAVMALESVIMPSIGEAGGPDNSVVPSPVISSDTLSRQASNEFYQQQLNNTLAAERYVARLSINDSFIAGLVDGALITSVAGTTLLGGLYLVRRRSALHG